MNFPERGDNCVISGVVWFDGLSLEDRDLSDWKFQSQDLSSKYSSERLDSWLIDPLYDHLNGIQTYQKWTHGPWSIVQGLNSVPEILKISDLLK